MTNCSWLEARPLSSPFTEHVLSQLRLLLASMALLIWTTPTPSIWVWMTLWATSPEATPASWTLVAWVSGALLVAALEVSQHRISACRDTSRRIVSLPLSGAVLMPGSLLPSATMAFSRSTLCHQKRSIAFYYDWLRLWIKSLITKFSLRNKTKIERVVLIPLKVITVWNIIISLTTVSIKGSRAPIVCNISVNFQIHGWPRYCTPTVFKVVGWLHVGSLLVTSWTVGKQPSGSVCDYFCSTYVAWIFEL